MAKCIKSVESDRIRRVPNKVAEKEVESGKWEYCSKSEWKRSKQQ